MRTILVLLSFIPATLIAADDKTNEEFARAMLVCGYRHASSGLIYGDATISERTAKEAEPFTDAALKATSTQFVEREFPKIKQTTQAEVLGKLQTSKSQEEFLKWLSESDNACAKKLADFTGRKIANQSLNTDAPKDGAPVS